MTNKEWLDIELQKKGVDPSRLMRLTRNDVATIVENAKAELAAHAAALTARNVELESALRFCQAHHGAECAQEPNTDGPRAASGQ